MTEGGTSPALERQPRPATAGADPREAAGPVVVLDQRGALRGSSGPAAVLTRLWSSGRSPRLAAAVASALGGQIAHVAPLDPGKELGEEAGAQVLDLIVVPWADGGVAIIGRDISLERSLRDALVDSRQRYKDLVEASSDFAWETGPDGRFTFVTPRGALGYPAAVLVGQDPRGLVMDVGAQGHAPFLCRAPLSGVEVWVRDAGSKAVCLLANAIPLVGPDGRWCGARGTCRDITEQRLREAELARAAQRQSLLAYLLRMTREQAEPARMLAAVARALLPALSAAGAEIQCRTEAGTLLSMAQAGAAPPGEGFQPLIARLGETGDGLNETVEGDRLLVFATAYGGRRNGLLCLWRRGGEAEWGDDGDVLLEEVLAQVGVANRQLQREDRLERLSTTDPLTGLQNRRGFVANLARLLERRPDDDHPLSALFYIDLDNFKQINDSLGHQAGDRALERIAGLLRQQIRAGDLAARLGGDEFALFFPAMSEDAARGKGTALLEASQELAALSADRRFPLGLSVGIAMADARRPETAEALIERADAAMYAIKHDGKGGVTFARPPSGAP